MIDDSFIYNNFKKIEEKFISNDNKHIVPPKLAQIGLGITAKKFKNQKYSSGCAGHTLLFNTKKIISSYCFNCYKIEIHPNNVLELFKLLFFFDDLNLENNNHRKLWLRPKKDLKINYSGTIYFQSIDEAKQVYDFLTDSISKEISKNINLKLKRGCTGFNSLLENYHDINFNYDNLVKDKEKWNQIESVFDSSEELKKLPSIQLNELPKIRKFNIFHFRVMCSWLRFADSIGDESYKIITKTPLDKFFI